MKIICLSFILIIGFSLSAQLQTVADFKNKVVCNYLQTKPFIDEIRTNIHGGNASLSCVQVKNIPTSAKNINSSPIKVNMQKQSGLICYSINTPAYKDERRGHMHGGHSAISCVKSVEP